MLLADAVATRGSIELVEPDSQCDYALRLIVDADTLTNHGARGYSVAALLYRKVSLLEDLSSEYCAELERDEELMKFLHAVDGAELPLLMTCESGAPLTEKVERIIGRVLDEIGHGERAPLDFDFHPAADRASSRISPSATTKPSSVRSSPANEWTFRYTCRGGSA